MPARCRVVVCGAVWSRGLVAGRSHPTGGAPRGRGPRLSLLLRAMRRLRGGPASNFSPGRVSANPATIDAGAPTLLVGDAECDAVRVVIVAETLAGAAVRPGDGTAGGQIPGGNHGGYRKRIPAIRRFFTLGISYGSRADIRRESGQISRQFATWRHAALTDGSELDVVAQSRNRPGPAKVGAGPPNRASRRNPPAHP